MTPEAFSIQRDPRLNLPPPDEPPVLLDAAGQRHLLALLGAHRRRELQLGEVGLDRHHARARAHRPNVQHQHLRLGQLRHLALLLAPLRAHAQQPPEQEKVNLQLGEHLGQFTNLAQHLADQPVRARQRRVHGRADADQPAGHGVLELVLLREERDDAARDGRALDASLGIFADDARTHLDRLPNLEHALQDGPARDAALDVVHLRAGLVHVEAPDDDHVARRDEVALRHRDLPADVLAHHVDVVLELRRDGNHGSSVRDRALDELHDRVVLVRRRVLLH
mmetsp:Transcript_236/g.920  ORF Transcript_236/g.920 Transcript_236/m.920 type:complete len:280 (+) Transcript_236:142-981(+)